MEVLDNLVFYNHYGAGDLFESREFIKAYMERIPAKTYSYAHGKNPRIFRDIENLQSVNIEEWMPMRAAAAYVNKTNLIINTWIGRDGKYVLPGIGCTIEKLYEMHNDILNELNLSPLEKPIIEYAPKVNWEYFKTEPIIKWLEEHKDTKKILISNGPVQSNQAENFSFTNIIRNLGEKYKYILFLVTQPDEILSENIVYTENITKTSDKFDLNEIGYLSLYCDIFIGRCSGPHVFAQNYDNWNNPLKTSLSFTYTAYGSHNIYTNLVKMKRYWSAKVDPNEVFDACCKVIEK
jgi:hypothetical protein